MNELFVNSTTIGVVISLLAYQLGTFLRNKTKKAIFNPLLISVIMVIAFLLIFDIDYEHYNQSAKYLSYLLTPATVSLAIVLTSLVSIWGMSLLFGLSHSEYVTLLPKSITTAIGIGVSEELGGYVSITATSIIITGILGNIVGEFICKCFRIKNAISKGLALGTSSHAIGTTKAMEMGEIEGAMSSLSIVVAGLMTVVLASIFAILH